MCRLSKYFGLVRLFFCVVRVCPSLFNNFVYFYLCLLADLILFILYCCQQTILHLCLTDIETFGCAQHPKEPTEHQLRNQIKYSSDVPHLESPHVCSFASGMNFNLIECNVKQNGCQQIQTQRYQMCDHDSLI